MRRVRYHAHGGPEVLAIEEAAVPSPGPGQVLIRTEGIGVNYVDVQLRRATDPSCYGGQQPRSGPEPTSLSWPACSRPANFSPSPSLSHCPRS